MSMSASRASRLFEQADLMVELDARVSASANALSSSRIVGLSCSSAVLVAGHDVSSLLAGDSDGGLDFMWKVEECEERRRSLGRRPKLRPSSSKEAWHMWRYVKRY